MSPIIAQTAHPSPDAARKRADRLAKASPDQIEAALAYLSMIDPEAFEIALTVVAPTPTRLRTTSPSRCAAPAAPRSPSSPNSPLTGVTSVATPPPPVPIETYDADHAAEVAWYLPQEAAEEF